MNEVVQYKIKKKRSTHKILISVLSVHVLLWVDVFYVVEELMTWHEAVEHCAANGGVLSSGANNQEHDRVTYWWRDERAKIGKS